MPISRLVFCTYFCILFFMKNIFVGKQGKGVLVGILFTISAFVATVMNAGIVHNIAGIVILGAVISLFMSKYRPYGKGFLIGSLGSFAIVSLGSVLITVVIVAIQGA